MDRLVCCFGFRRQGHRCIAKLRAVVFLMHFTISLPAHVLQVTHDVSHLTCADFLRSPGVQTPIIVRFSVVVRLKVKVSRAL